jgi:hypothetical protein
MNHQDRETDIGRALATIVSISAEVKKHREVPELDSLREISIQLIEETYVQLFSPNDMNNFFRACYLLVP